jgi:hypothetical protein
MFNYVLAMPFEVTDDMGLVLNGATDWQYVPLQDGIMQYFWHESVAGLVIDPGANIFLDGDVRSHAELAGLISLCLLLTRLRANTLGGVRMSDPARPDDPGDIYFSSHGYLCFTVRRVKRGSAHIQAFVKSISPPPAANTLRNMIWAKLRLALAVKKDGSRLIGPRLWGDDPKWVADVISTKMKEILHRGDCGIPLGTFISSHS